MGELNFAKAVDAASKKVYYVITHMGQKCGTTNGRGQGGFSTTGTPDKFSTFGKALERLSVSHSSPDWGITKITETPSAETRRVLTDCECPKGGETVKFAVDAGYGYIIGAHHGQPLSNATLFNTAREATQAVVNRGTSWSKESSVIRIAVAAGNATVTEEVLG